MDTPETSSEEVEIYPMTNEEVDVSEKSIKLLPEGMRHKVTRLYSTVRYWQEQTRHEANRFAAEREQHAATLRRLSDTVEQGVAAAEAVVVRFHARSFMLGVGATSVAAGLLMLI